MTGKVPAAVRALVRWNPERERLWTRGPDAGSSFVADTELERLAYKYLTGRVRRGEIATTTASNHWSTLTVLGKVHGHRPVGQLGKRTIEKWLEARSSLKPSARRSQWSYVSAFCDWLVEEGHIVANPCRKMKPPKRPRIVPRTVDADAVRALLDVAPDARARAIVWLMVGEGLRCVSVSRLKVEDWSRRDQTLRVNGKGGHEHVIPVMDDVAHALTAYLAEHPATSGPMIRSYRQDWKPLAPGTLSHFMSAWMLLAGVKLASGDGISAHALRRTCASDVLDQSQDVRVASELLGHKHLSSIAPYIRNASLPKMREAMEGRDYRAS